MRAQRRGPLAPVDRVSADPAAKRQRQQTGQPSHLTRRAEFVDTDAHNLGDRDLAGRLGKGTVLRAAAIEDAGLVEMDVRLDEARHREQAVPVDDLGVTRECLADGDDDAASDADVDAGFSRAVRDAQVLDDQIDDPLSSGESSRRCT